MSSKYKNRLKCWCRHATGHNISTCVIMKFSSLQILFMGKRLYKSGKTTDTETLHDSNPVVNAAEVIKLPDGCAECKCLYKNATL